jgi:anti-sigma regulatory factor (Ser/Thr protein kinase)
MTATPARTAPATDPTDPFVHDALLYRDPPAYLAGTLPFIYDGLAAGDPVLVAVPAYHVDVLRTELNGDAGKVRFVDMGKAGRNPGRIIPAVLRAFVDQHAPRRARIIGEPIWPGRSDVEYPACVQHEALINSVFAGRTATILCPYDARRLDPTVIADAARTHPTLVDDGGRRASDAYAGAQPVVDDFNRPLPEPATPAASFVFADAAALAAVRRLVASHANRAGLDPVRVEDLQVAVNELCTNTLSHAGGSGTVRVWRDGDRLVCEVRDRGALTDPLAGRIPPPPSSVHGRGLLLVNYVCDLVRIHTDKTGTTVQVWMSL